MNRRVYKSLKNPTTLCMKHFNHDSFFAQNILKQKPKQMFYQNVDSTLEISKCPPQQNVQCIKYHQSRGYSPPQLEAQSGSFHSKGLRSRSAHLPCEAPCSGLPHVLSSCLNDFSTICLILSLVTDSGLPVFPRPSDSKKPMEERAFVHLMCSHELSPALAPTRWWMI